MGTSAERLTIKQQRLVKALGTGKASSITEAARMAGMDRSHASEVLRKPAVAEALSRTKLGQADTARDYAGRAMRKAGSTLDYLDPSRDDPEVVARTAGAVITVAKIHAESFETPDSPEQQASERAAKRILLKRALVAGVLVAIRAGKRGRSVEEMRAWCAEYLRSLD